MKFIKYRLIFGFCILAGTAAAQTEQKSSASADNPGTPPPAAAFQPGLDDLMTMLVQPRHIKLYYAGVANNWELAAFELKELRAAFKRAAQVVPRYQENDVSIALQTFIDPRLQALDAAIRVGNAKHFAEQFSELTAACNSCHTFMEHPFLIIKIPGTASGSAYVDQRFGK